ncbi:hypothetical protein BJF82_08495 [Kytococcus sp. CUA-901]|nr:hypothetical protein BJF82_08495 [Kytococcus sp. CUA-901]
MNVAPAWYTKASTITRGSAIDAGAQATAAVTPRAPKTCTRTPTVRMWRESCWSATSPAVPMKNNAGSATASITAARPTAPCGEASTQSMSATISILEAAVTSPRPATTHGTSGTSTGTAVEGC